MIKTYMVIIAFCICDDGRQNQKDYQVIVSVLTSVVTNAEYYLIVIDLHFALPMPLREQLPPSKPLSLQTQWTYRYSIVPQS